MSNMTTPVQNENMNWNTSPSLGTKFFLVFVSSNLETLHMTRKNLLLAAWYRQYTRACEYDPKKTHMRFFLQEAYQSRSAPVLFWTLLPCKSWCMFQCLQQKLWRVGGHLPIGTNHQSVPPATSGRFKIALAPGLTIPEPWKVRCVATHRQVKWNKGSPSVPWDYETFVQSTYMFKKATHTHQVLKHKSRFVNFCFGCALDLFARRACGLSFIPSPYPTHRPATVVTTPPLIFWTLSLPVSLDSRSHHGI